MIEQTLTTLRSAGVKKVYVSIDGPSTNDILNLQTEIERIVDKFHSNLFQIVVRKSSRNFGLALGVITAIDWFFQQEEKGFILEEDIRISQSFIDYGVWSLEHLDKNPRCLFAGGFYIDKSEFSTSDPFICKYPMIWGWVTNQLNWSIMRELILAPKSLTLDVFLNKHLQYWYVGAKRASLGLIDTWDIQLTYEFLRKDYYCILPPAPLVQNQGFDELATHTKAKNPLLLVDIKEDTNFTSAHLVQSADHLDLYYHFIEQKIYKMSRRNLFSLYKFWLEYLWQRKKPYPQSLLEKIRNFQTQDDAFDVTLPPVSQ